MAKECVIAHWSSGRAPTIERGSSAPPKPRIRRDRLRRPHVGGWWGAAGGRGASRAGGSRRVTGGGRRGSENAGMSSDTGVGSPSAV